MTSSRLLAGDVRIGAAAVLGALALAGCSATHVGESWQCPLAQGEECASVAAADPAVPETAGPAAPVLPEPLYRVRSAGEGHEAEVTVREARRCGGPCGPIAWLARLLGVDGDEAADRSKGERTGEPPGLASEADGAAAAHGRDGRESPVDGETVSDSRRAPVEAAGPLPAPAVPAGSDGLREAEVIGRIWIAPFVDADGLYREGHWVRAVLAPAAWRRP